MGSCSDDEGEDSIDADQTGDFLDKLRLDESHHHTSRPSSKSKSQSKQKEQLKKMLDDDRHPKNHADHPLGTGIEYQELVIIEDLFFILLGIEGTFIEYHENFSPDDPFERLQGARFSIDNDLGLSPLSLEIHIKDQT